MKNRITYSPDGHTVRVSLVKKTTVYLCIGDDFIQARLRPTDPAAKPRELEAGRHEFYSHMRVYSGLSIRGKYHYAERVGMDPF